uniref:Tail protein n=4 Tax=unclassified bacterial viruses TaxID=12333 RepID=A0AAU6W3J7_9VIRU
MGQQMGSSFQRRRLRITFKLAAGTFTREGEPDTAIFEDYRSQVDIDAPGGYQFATCRMRIFGIDALTMNRLTVINYQNLDFLRNSIQIEASDEDGQFTSIFLGEIYIAQPDYAGAPDVPFIVEARSGLIGSLKPSQANSFPGSQKVSAIMSRLAAELGVSLEDNGVTQTVTDMYLAGSALHKVQVIAEAARIQYWYLPEQGLLAIAPMGVARRSESISYTLNNGLVGWPTKTHVGIAFTALFRPSTYHGCKILMEQDVIACNGEWYIISISHRLESETPGGAWFTHFVATPQNTTIRSR